MLIYVYYKSTRMYTEIGIRIPCKHTLIAAHTCVRVNRRTHAHWDGEWKVHSSRGVRDNESQRTGWTREWREEGEGGWSPAAFPEGQGHDGRYTKNKVRAVYKGVDLVEACCIGPERCMAPVDPGAEELEALLLPVPSRSRTGPRSCP